MAIRIHPTAEIDASATVGEGTQIWHWAQLREGAIVGRNCRIGKDVYIDVKVSVGADCKIQKFAALYRGVRIGQPVSVGPPACFTNHKYTRSCNANSRGRPTAE